MSQYKIVFTDYYYPSNEQEIKILQGLGDVEIIDGTKITQGGLRDEDSILTYARDADAVIVQFARITQDVIQGLEKCKIISRYAIGVDNIDVHAAKNKGIVVANVPGYCLEEVSDNTLAHMMNCIRKVSLASSLLFNGEWEYQKIKPIHRFSNYTVGLFAFGSIARRVAEKLRGFGVTILAYDPYFKDKKSYKWMQFVSMEELLSKSDILSVHAPLNKETYHLFDKEKFTCMKDGVIIINTSRGGLIDEKALADAIESGKVSMCGLDVLEYEDTDYHKSILLKYPGRVIITPHMSWYSEESIVDLQKKTALNVYEMLKNGKPLYSV
ncbi:MAG: C-terminal binding protein [Spirochaetota bacterium]